MNSCFAGCVEQGEDDGEEQKTPNNYHGGAMIKRWKGGRSAGVAV